MKLTIIVPEMELFDQDKEEFIQVKSQKLTLIHSLVSLSKWESKWKKPYLNNKLTREEQLDYIRCMTTTQNVDPMIYRVLTPEIIDRINDYISDPMTATTINDDQKKTGGSVVVTSELIYYWMSLFNLPVEYEKWHLNRLLTLIQLCEIKSREPKKMSRSEILRKQYALNEERKKKYNTRG